MSSPYSDCLSPSSGELTPELHDATELLEDDTETDGDRHQFSPARTFPSSFTSHWSQPWSKNTGLCRSPRKFEWSPPPLDYGNSVGSAQKYEGVGTNLSRSTWPFQYNTKRFVMVAGMENLGNTCFLNSVLQCFIHTVPILRGILSDGNLLHSNCNKEGFCLLCALGDLIVCSLTNNIVSPHNMADNLSYISSSFKRFQQEDAHEFLQCFLGRLEDCYDSESKGCTSLQSDNIVKQVFGGRVVSNLKCCNCGHCSDTYEPSVDLSLEIDDADNLLLALQSFTKVERIEDSDTQFTCEKCKEQVSVEKKLTFDQAPSVAVFHLKRFKNDGCFVQKIDKHVSFPLDLDMQPFTGSNEKSVTELKYVLYAVVVHIGLTSTSGHYYCFIRLSPNMWCKFDDSKVVLVSEDFVLSQDAYILFYAKESTPWFSSFIESQKECVHSSIRNTSPKSVLDKLDTFPCGLNPDGASHGFGPENSKVDNNEIKHSEPSHGFRSEHSKVDNCEIKYGRPVQNKIESRGSKYNFHISDSVARRSSPIPAVYLPTVSSVLLEKAVRNQEDRKLPDHENDIHTPFRSPSPEIYREDPPDAGFSIPRGQRLAERMSCKRRLDKDMDDPEIRQARSFIRKSMHSSRRQQLLAAIMVPENESSANTKKSRSGASIRRNSNTRRTPLRFGTNR
ncbi:hypothetical protein ACS0TY_001517 [Phlomoides rotata]